MRLDLISDDYYKIYINKEYISSFDQENNEELGKYIKNTILKIRKFYGVILEGFYEINVYIAKLFGLILEIKNIDSYPSKTIDLKIVVHNDSECYIKICRYELISDYDNLKYLDNAFYLSVNDIEEDDVIKLVEDVEIVYGEDIDNIKNKWKVVFK